jgi:hypothetical protein
MHDAIDRHDAPHDHESSASPSMASRVCWDAGARQEPRRSHGVVEVDPHRLLARAGDAVLGSAAAQHRISRFALAAFASALAPPPEPRSPVAWPLHRVPAITPPSPSLLRHRP